MYLEQFYLACLAHASHMIGSEGVAAVVDPQRDVLQMVNVSGGFDAWKAAGLPVAQVALA